MLPQPHVKTPSPDVTAPLRAPLADINRIAKRLQAHHRLNHDDATLQCLQIVRESTRDMQRFIAKVQLLIALENVIVRRGGRVLARDAKDDEATFYFKVPADDI